MKFEKFISDKRTMVVDASPVLIAVLANVLIFHHVMTEYTLKSVVLAGTGPKTIQNDASKATPMGIVLECFVSTSKAVGLVVIEDVAG